MVAVGTHALISGSTEFKNLGLVITDEQHLGNNVADSPLLSVCHFKRQGFSENCHILHSGEHPAGVFGAGSVFYQYHSQLKRL